MRAPARAKARPPRTVPPPWKPACRTAWEFPGPRQWLPLNLTFPCRIAQETCLPFSETKKKYYFLTIGKNCNIFKKKSLDSILTVFPAIYSLKIRSLFARVALNAQTCDAFTSLKMFFDTPHSAEPFRKGTRAHNARETWPSANPVGLTRLPVSPAATATRAARPPSAPPPHLAPSPRRRPPGRFRSPPGKHL